MPHTIHAVINMHPPLIIESYPSTYTGLPFITLIQHRNHPWLTIVDNTTQQTITAYVLDLCGPERVDQLEMLEVASEWYEQGRNALYPLSVEFSRLHMSGHTSRVLRTLNVEFITRVIGPVFTFPMEGTKNVKRKRIRNSTTPTQPQYIT